MSPLPTLAAVAAVTGLAMLPACRDGGTGGSAAAPAGAPTWARDIGPLVHASCAPCHRPGQPAPFALLTYEDAVEHGDQIAEVTADRLMPPWLPTHGDFVGDRRLADADVARLGAWVDAGAPRGEARDEPPPPAFPDGWQLGEPDLVLAVDAAIEVAAAGPERFRNYVVPARVDAVRFVAAVEIRPGSTAVHHAVLALEPTDRARRLDARDAEPGFPGMDLGGARPPDGYFVGWTPGKVARRSPPGMAWRLAPGDNLVLQLHLTPTGRRETVRPRIGLWFTDEPPRAVSYPLCLFAADIDLPPGAADVPVADHVVVPVPVTVHSLYPHAHYLCRTMAVWATPPGGARLDLLRIDRWDFDWQDDYTLRTPLSLPAGTRIEFEYRYDNSAANPANPSSPPRHVRLGDSSTDEMGNLTLQVTTADLDARRRLGEASVRRGLEKRPRDTALLLELAVLLRETGRLGEAVETLATAQRYAPLEPELWCELGTCLAAAGRADEAERAYRECLRLEPRHLVARVQLGNLLLRGGHAELALAAYDEALAQGLEAPSLHNNLAAACLALGRLDRAERHYRRTVELDPTFFQAWLNLGRVLASRGHTAEARTALGRALALRPGDARAAEALQQLGR